MKEWTFSEKAGFILFGCIDFLREGDGKSYLIKNLKKVLLSIIIVTPQYLVPLPVEKTCYFLRNLGRNSFNVDRL